MATLAANKKIDYELGEDPLLNDIPVVATDIVYEGAAVGESASTGTGRPLVSGDTFLGMAVAKCDNSTGAAGDKNIRVRQRGTMKVAVAIVAGIADLGANVYASDDDVYTLSSVGTSLIGTVTRYVSGTTCLVRFESDAVRSI